MKRYKVQLTREERDQLQNRFHRAYACTQIDTSQNSTESGCRYDKNKIQSGVGCGEQYRYKCLPLISNSAADPH